MAVENLNRSYDYTLVFEADGYINSSVEEFVDIVYKSCEIADNDDVYYIGLANNPTRYREDVNEDFIKTGHNQDLAHCYLIRNRDREWWNDIIKDSEWDVGDLWFNHIFYNHPQLRYTTRKEYSKQAEGYSLLDETIKTWD
jgi:hypothetical protein